MPRILIADDQADVLAALRLLLKGDGYDIEGASSPAGVLQAVDAQELDVVLMDLNYARDTTSGSEGLDLLTRIQTVDPTLPVVVMTAWGSVNLAVEVMRRGARDFIQKPWDNARLLAVLRTQVELAKALRRGQRLEAENLALRDSAADATANLPRVIAESQAMKAILKVVERIGPADANVLITGENGAGKEVIARALHTSSARAAKPLVSLNAGALAEGLFESELFGHVRGAFTDAKADRVGRFELADGGTLFLDEIANVPLNLQPKLLRVLETGEFERVGSSKTRKVDVRVLSATNADLNADVAQGKFRQDLLFRLNTVEIHLPPLRERREDIPPLAEHFLRQHSERYRRGVMGLTPQALEALRQHAWPGNVRELDHVIERAVLMSSSSVVTAFDLALQSTPDARLSARLEEMSLEEAERLLIKKALARFEGNANRAAEALGLSRSALYRRLQKYGLS
ncbi:MAG: response regulator with CheY-like receiver, AAA-type ATPase, and DNA-binding domain [Acidobacteria bacterium]|nr:response regulator with CheY-like receiver, AAA-type ATPase, and DNA-binding domain [Acidobacteriota bacterium]